MAYAWVGEFAWKPWKGNDKSVGDESALDNPQIGLRPPIPFAQWEGEERNVDDDSLTSPGTGVFKKRLPDRPGKIAGTHHYDVPLDKSPKR